MDPSEPRYLSNVSAVGLESGQYQECVDVIRRVWALIGHNGPPQDHPLAPKLAARLSKAALYGGFELDGENDKDILALSAANTQCKVASKRDADHGMERALNTPVFKSRLWVTFSLLSFSLTNVILSGIPQRSFTS
jgi:hypothetical protein